MPGLKRKKRKDELRQARMLKKRQELRKADPQKMAALRQKFVNQAKKYYGYPYARKYWPPDSPEYKSKLFLDCCGLVRKVMRDLAEDFGFIIGPWNQAYMFDTLPIKVEREKDMKPGDLVFISATYYNPKSKKQRHNMTHVEIWAGEGNKTIGSRWNNGKVQMFDHYKFLAKSYHSETYHLRSIDTWLKGICTSHCSQHSWRRSKYNPSKKSIFSLPEQADEDEAAGDDDNIDSFAVRGSTFIDDVAGVSKMVEQCKKAESERPKTDMDLRHVHSDSSLSMSTSHSEHTKFPVIKNNLGEKGKGGKRTKGRNNCVSRENDMGDRKDDVGEGAAAANMSDVDKPELGEVNKSLGQLSISGSLTDLGKKGFYLKDLVDSQIKEENPSNEEAEIENKEGEEKCASGDDSDDEYLSNRSEEDLDDDYFIFVNDDQDSDVEKEVCDVSDAIPETRAETTHIDGEVKGGMGKCELVNNEGENVEEGGDSRSVEERKMESRVEVNESHEVVRHDDSCVQDEMSANGRSNDICKAKGDDVILDGSSCNECKDEVEELNEQKVEGCVGQLTDGNGVCDGMNGKCKGPHTDLTMTDTGMKELKETNGQIDASVAGSNTEKLDNCCYGNTNENANPKTTEQTQSNKQEKMKIECIKPSVVTMVSQVPQTSRPLTGTQTMQTPVLPAESATSITLPVTRSSGSSSSCDFEDRKKTDSLTGAK